MARWATGASWEAQWDAFTANYNCVTYSRRYSFPNRNDMPSPDHSALDEAQDLRLLLDALGWRRVISNSRSADSPHSLWRLPTLNGCSRWSRSSRR